MSETKETTTEEKPKEPISNAKEGDKPRSPNLIEQASEAGQRLERANEEARQILARNEELAARNLLGGQSEVVVTEPVQMSDEDYAKAAIRGEVPVKE